MMDKNQVMANLGQRKSVVLDLGCGPRKRDAAWIGIDMLDYPGVDLVGDVYEIVAAFPDQSVDEVHAYHFFEHIPDVPLLLKELSRVLKPTGYIEIVVPHFSNPYFYSDYTHKSFFGLYTMSYLVKDNLFRRRVPDYQVNIGLQLESVLLRFKSALWINRPIRRVWQVVFNASNLIREWYEDSWSRHIPCYEIKYVLTKIRD